MGYAQAVDKAWSDIPKGAAEENYSIRLLSDTYTIDTGKRTIISDSCNVPAKEHISIILLHYLAKKLALKNLPQPAGEWIDFRQLEGGEGYYPAFKKRTIDKVLKKYGPDPDALFGLSDRFPCEKSNTRDAGIIIQAMESVPILIAIQKADEEFGADANILFDRAIPAIFCTEDVVVLTEIVAHSL